MSGLLPIPCLWARACLRCERGGPCRPFILATKNSFRSKQRIMKKIDAIRALLIEDAMKSQVDNFDRLIGYIKKRSTIDDEFFQILNDESPFELQEKLFGDITGERLLSIFGVMFAVINAPRSTDSDQLAALDGFMNNIFLEDRLSH